MLDNIVWSPPGAQKELPSEVRGSKEEASSRFGPLRLGFRV